MIFKAIDENYCQSDCGRYAISRAPSASSAAFGREIVYKLWRGKELVGTELCRNYVHERNEAMQSLRQMADDDSGVVREGA